ncbi:MAG: thrombospondin type 3 repeat-containing protein [Proteobacteria bacterium]|nr:thrombospondin type 3 repeat-containing protein [Pseudomonadota bacterium]MBU4294735.1 thrombospondin type 3 repeat-containing protein [Pseudomonadota bacterium]MCG2746485.1 thrombospondin type 3 repeat-containing protein [Desulfobulbaceae bacterium]
MDNGLAWLLTNQNSSGSWGEPHLTEFRDTAVVADILKKYRKTGAEYDYAISFIKNFTPANNDYLARKTSVLAQEGIDVSLLVDELLAAQNPNEADNTLPNYPEGGWGAAAGYATNCLDTLLVLDSLRLAGIPQGLLVSEKSIAAGETQEFAFDYPIDAANLQIFISAISGSITFRLFPSDSTTYYSWGPITSATYLTTTGITIEPGRRRIQIYGNAASTYSLQITLTSGGYDSSALIDPLAYLMGAQNPDGGWGLSRGAESNIYMTSKVLIGFEGYAGSFDLEKAINAGISWLKGQQNADYGFGTEGSCIYQTALAYTAIANLDLACPEAQNTLAYILANQQADGSWNNKAYDTAVSLLALFTSMRETDTDGDGVPELMDNCPDDPNADQKNTDEEYDGLSGYPAGDEMGDVCDDDDDNDGISDDYERDYTGTDPFLIDTDNDGIADNLEDLDFDGVSNEDEFALGTDPKAPDINFSKGLNLFGYPVAVPGGYTSYDLIVDLGSEAEIEKIQRYNSATGAFETTTCEGGVAGGDEFDIISGEGYLVYMKKAKSLSFVDQIASPTITLQPGFNIVSFPCMPHGYTSYDLLWMLGSSDTAASIQRLNRETGTFETTAYDDNLPAGGYFDIVNSEAFIVHMRSTVTVPTLLVAPDIAITSPVEGATVSASPIDVSGTITDSTAIVTVNGIRANVSAGTFTAAGVPLTSGLNTITATAMSANNLTDFDTVSVTLEEGVDYEIIKGGFVSDSRIFTGDAALLDQAAYYTEIPIGIPAYITYTTTGVSRVSATEMEIFFSIQVSGTALEGISEFQVEYGLEDGGGNPLEPLTNNIFSFRIKVLP